MLHCKTPFTLGLHLLLVHEQLQVLAAVVVGVYSNTQMTGMHVCRTRYKYGWKLTLLFNYVLITCTFVFGMGFGMWASMLDLIKNTNEFGIFAACYNCAR